MAIKKHDFVEIEYTGRLEEDDIVFDTTDETLAKESGINGPNTEYGPIIICIGENQVLEGIDKNLIGKEPGAYKFKLIPEQAIRKKNARLIQLIPTRKFIKENIQPAIGLQVNVDGAMGVIRTVTGGRTLVDFNHPLSGKDVVYDVKVKRLVTDRKEQAEAYLNITLRIKDKEINITDSTADIRTKINLPDDIKANLSAKMKEIFKLDDIKFTVQKETPKKEEKKEEKEENNKEKSEEQAEKHQKIDKS